MNIPEINKRIVQIESVINESNQLIQTIGLKSGALGFSLFYYYYYLYTNEEKYLYKISFYIDSVFNKISNDNIEVLDTVELLEIGRCLCFFKNQKMLSIGDVIGNLKEIEEPIMNYLNFKIKEKDLDAIDGVVAVGHYLLDAIDLLKYVGAIKKIVRIIDQLSIMAENNSLYWVFPMRDKNNPIVELGFFHGVSGVVNFLVRVYEKNIHPEKCYIIIQGAINFLLTQKQNRGINLFPFDTNSNKRLMYQNINYGDFGVGYTIYKSGVVLKHKFFEKKGIEILINSAHFRDWDKKHIKDAELIYGSSGMFALSDLLEKNTKKIIFSKSKNYWLDTTLEFNKNQTPWAGYSTYINGFDDDIQMSFSHGICGIGIALMNYKLKLDHEYLSFFNYR